MERPWRERRWRLISVALTGIGLGLAVALAHVAASDGFAYDAHAYWNAGGYGRPADHPDAFVYSPPVLLLFQGIHAVVPWPLFLELWSLAIAVGIAVLAGPFTGLVVFTPWVAWELTLGNIHVFLALVAVLGFRWPGVWAITLLTKPTSGVALLWFAVRREWRALAIALGVTAAIAVPTIVLAPDLWGGYLDVLRSSNTGAVRSSFGVPLVVRLVIAAVVVIIGAVRGWRWTVPLAALIGLPIIWEVHSLSMLLGVLALVRVRPRERPTGEPSTSGAHDLEGVAA